MKNQEVFTLFDKLYIEAYKNEHDKEMMAIYKNNIYKEIYKNVSKYSKEDWKRIKERLDYIYENMIILMDKNPSDQEVQYYVEELRKYYSDTFYNCDLVMFRSLGKLYKQDVKFKKTTNDKREGLSEFLGEAIEIYCDIHQ